MDKTCSLVFHKVGYQEVAWQPVVDERGTEARPYHTVPYVLWPPEGHRRGDRECLSGIFIILEDLPFVHYDPLDRQIVWMVGHHSSGATAISDPHRLSEGRNSWDIASPCSSLCPLRLY